MAGGALDQEIGFCPTARGSLAFATVGAGPLLVLPPPCIGHVGLEWEFPDVRAFVTGLARDHRVVRYDRLGTGMSDRPADGGPPSLAADVEALGALLDHLGEDAASLFGFSYGGCAAVATAARLPARVDRLVLFGAYPDGADIAEPSLREALLSTVAAHWGLGSRMLADVWMPGVGRDTRQAFAQLQRAAATAEEAVRALEAVYAADVRDAAAAVQAPTLVLHRRDDRAIPADLGRRLASLIPGARLALLPGDLHPPWLGDSDAVVRATRDFLGPAEPATSARPPVELPVDDVLSGREREVLRLIADGLTDAVIAERLVLSPHTVHRHVANIRTKLDAPSRAAAAVVGARRGLI